MTSTNALHSDKTKEQENSEILPPVPPLPSTVAAAAARRTASRPRIAHQTVSVERVLIPNPSSSCQTGCVTITSTSRNSSESTNLMPPRLVKNHPDNNKEVYDTTRPPTRPDAEESQGTQNSLPNFLRYQQKNIMNATDNPVKEENIHRGRGQPILKAKPSLVHHPPPPNVNRSNQSQSPHRMMAVPEEPPVGRPIVRGVRRRAFPTPISNIPGAHAINGEGVHLNDEERTVDDSVTTNNNPTASMDLESPILLEAYAVEEQSIMTAPVGQQATNATTAREQPLVEAVPAPPLQERNQKNRFLKIIAAIGCVGCFVAMAVALVLTGRNNSSSEATTSSPPWATTSLPTPSPSTMPPWTPVPQYATKLLASDGSFSDWFGGSVAVDGDTLVVGAPGDEGARGSVYVFLINVGGSGASWTVQQQAKLVASDGAQNDSFGTSVAISGNTLVIGAPGDAGGGSGYIFTRSGTIWSQTAKLTVHDDPPEEGELLFGVSVGIFQDTIVVGASSNNDDNTTGGSAYIYRRSDGSTSWSYEAKLVADGISQFGISVGIYEDTVVVGASRSDGQGYSTGSAFVFANNQTSWSQQAKLVANDAAVNDAFGSSVASFGDIVVVGAYQDDDGGDDSGSVYIFSRSGTEWGEWAKLTASDAAAGDNFGCAVAISGETIVVGANRGDVGEIPDGGNVYTFYRSGSAWSQQAKLTANDTRSFDYFGSSVAISDGTILVGAYGDDDSGSWSGSAYVFN